MSDFERDQKVDAVLTGVSREVAGYIRPAGATAVVETVRRRHRNRVVAGGILAAALVLGPVAGLALAPNHPDSGPTGNQSSPSASESAVAPPSSAPPRSSSAAAVPGIPATELLNATLTLPAWPDGLPGSTDCTSGKVRFVNGRSTAKYGITILGQPIQVDVDGDGTPESVVRVVCSPQAASFQVLAYGRSDGGGIRLFGTVIATPDGAGRDGVDVKYVHAVEATSDGHVRVDVGDWSPCCGMPEDLPQHQWRTYGWNGQRFVQTGGPTKFGPHPKGTDLTVAGADVAMTRQSDGRWHGTVSVRVTNEGSKAARAAVEVRTSAPVTVAEPAPAGCNPLNPTFIACGPDDLAPGASRTVTIPVVSATDPTGTVTVAVRDTTGYPDHDPGNDTRTLRITAG
jgi:hypothetical protein